MYSVELAYNSYLDRSIRIHAIPHPVKLSEIDISTLVGSRDEAGDQVSCSVFLTNKCYTPLFECAWTLDRNLAGRIALTFGKGL